MKKINLSYENGNTFSVYVVRYFRFKTNVYLIYTLQEKDARDYMKLYVVKIMKELNENVSQTVRRNDEWKLMKGIVKTILTEIKNQQLTSIEDLDPTDLEGMTVYESKKFFIASDLVDVLSTELDKLNDSTLLVNNNFGENVSNIPEEAIEILELDDSMYDDSSFEGLISKDASLNSSQTEEEIEVLEL